MKEKKIRFEGLRREEVAYLKDKRKRLTRKNNMENLGATFIHKNLKKEITCLKIIGCNFSGHHSK
jgi:hypothetical protein